MKKQIRRINREYQPNRRNKRETINQSEESIGRETIKQKRPVERQSIKRNKIMST